MMKLKVHSATLREKEPVEGLLLVAIAAGADGRDFLIFFPLMMPFLLYRTVESVLQAWTPIHTERGNGAIAPLQCRHACQRIS